MKSEYSGALPNLGIYRSAKLLFDQHGERARLSNIRLSGWLAKLNS